MIGIPPGRIGEQVSLHKEHGGIVSDSVEGMEIVVEDIRDQDENLQQR